MSPLSQQIASGAAITAIAAYLDGLDHAARVAEVTALSASELSALYRLADGQHAELEHFVGPDVPAGQEVVHHGVNSLPLIGGTFRKRFTRLPDSAVLAGYNDSDGFVASVGWFTGPGYFLVRARGCPFPDGRTDTEQLFVDYYEQPDVAPVAGWPDPKPIIGFTAGLVFGKMCDYMWRVSEHVSIGEAYKRGKSEGQFFALVRQD